MSQDRGTSSAGRLTGRSITLCARLSLAAEEIEQHHHGHVADGQGGEDQQADEEQLKTEVHNPILGGAELQHAQHDGRDSEDDHRAPETGHHAVDQALFPHDRQLNAEGEQNIRREHEGEPG